MLRALRMAALVAGALMAATPVLAQDAGGGGDEIVVTGQRYSDRYQEFQIPHVAIVRRADYVVAQMAIESDTRDLGQRRDELMETLTDLGRRARSGPVTVALLEETDGNDNSGDTRVKPYTVDAARDQITSGSRIDTSRVSVLLRTRVTPDDTVASVRARLDGFVRALPKPGRVTLGLSNADLTVINPSQYRSAVIAAIAEDAHAIIAAMGPGEAVRIEGLENRIAWRRTGDLELSFYIPHRLFIVPGGAGASQ